MFTGLIETIGVIEQIQRAAHSVHLTLVAPDIMDDVKLGDSIAVNGVCLTVTAFDSNSFTVDAVPETVRRTNLSGLRKGHRVNLERALQVGGRLGGHFVSGHVDGVGKIVRVMREEIAVVIEIAADAACRRYIVEKGSVTVDGVSLTVMDVTDDGFRISLIPHTGHETTLGQAGVGTLVNLECDLLAKYALQLRSTQGHPPGAGQTPALSVRFLQENGFA